MNEIWPVLYSMKLNSLLFEREQRKIHLAFLLETQSNAVYVGHASFLKP